MRSPPSFDKACWIDFGATFQENMPRSDFADLKQLGCIHRLSCTCQVPATYTAYILCPVSTAFKVSLTGGAVQ